MNYNAHNTQRHTSHPCTCMYLGRPLPFPERAGKRGSYSGVCTDPRALEEAVVLRVVGVRLRERR